MKAAPRCRLRSPRKVITLFQQTSARGKAGRAAYPQETRLLKLLSEGYSYQNSAGQLNISINTVRNYIRSIYEKTPRQHQV
jgi:DNA-binding CsgD family transcriptional regulator